MSTKRPMTSGESTGSGDTGAGTRCGSEAGVILHKFVCALANEFEKRSGVS